MNGGRVNFQQTITGRSTSKRQRFVLIGGRSSYGHLFLKLSEEQIILSIFYDLNAKLSYKLDPNNNLFLSGYFGRDSQSFTNIYGNLF
jgi:hypothetical protein